MLVMVAARGFGFLSRARAGQGGCSAACPEGGAAPRAVCLAVDSYVHNDVGDVFEREPLVARFAAGAVQVSAFGRQGCAPLVDIFRRLSFTSSAFAPKPPTL